MSPGCSVFETNLLTPPTQLFFFFFLSLDFCRVTKPKNILQVHKISPSCSVFETNLKAFSFEVVVAGRVLHLQGCSFEDSLRWIATLKAAINNSPPDETDPLLAEALRLEDTFYYVRSWLIGWLAD